MSAAGAPTFLQDSIFGVKTFDTKNPVFDTVRSTLLAAKDRAGLSDAHEVAQGAYTSDDDIAPLVFSERSGMNRERIAFAKAPGAQVDDATSADRMARLMDTYSELETRVVRGIERACSELLFDSVVQRRAGGGNIAFTRKATHAAQAGTLWTAAGADPLGDLETTAELVAQDGYVVPKRVLMGKTAAAAFFANEAVRQQIDLRNNDTATRTHEEMENGGVYAGKCQAGRFSLQVFTYPCYYQETEAGAKSPFIPDDRVLILPSMKVSMANFILAFGAVPVIRKDAEGNGAMDIGSIDLVETRILPRLWSDASGENLFAVCESRPVPYSHTQDKIATIDVA